MTKIAHISIVHSPVDTRIFVKQCRSLAAHGYEVHLVAPGPPPGEPHGVQFRPLAPTFARPPLRRQWRLQRRAWREALRLGAGVYHLHDPHLIPLGLALKARGARVIYDVHEDYREHARTKLAGKPVRAHAKSGLWLALEALARRSFDRFVCVSEPIASRFPAGRVAIVRNYPRVDELADPTAPPYRERPPTVVFVGVTTRWRGFLDAVRAIEVVPDRLDCRLRLVGSVRPAQLVAEAATLPGWRRVEVVPWQPRAGVARELGRARIGLAAFHPVPNQCDPSGSNKLYEYMAAGLPVIVADHGGWRGLIESAGCGLAVDARDPRAIAGAIEHLLSRPDEAEAMGRRGRALVESRCNWDAELERLLWLYGTLNGHRSPAP